MTEMNFITREFSLRFDELPIAGDRIARAMGYTTTGMAPEVSAKLEQVLVDLPDHCDIKAGFVISPAASVRFDTNGFWCNDIFFRTEALIARQLDGSQEMAFFAATAGIGLDEWSKASAAQGDMLAAYLIDTCGSEIAEAATDVIEARIAEFAQTQGKSHTNRYSPGYCGWNVSEQHKLFSLLPERFCGITLTASSLMLPVKSVSGVIGLGDNVVKKEYQCARCEMTHCIRRIKP
ncbi:MAG: hypothetical protein MUF22_00115 [Chitinispirillaceae bacterium]|nr:hypothetical protein [Chitinispirillaceae bacterium]